MTEDWRPPEGLRGALSELSPRQALAFGLFLAVSAKPAFDSFAADVSWNGGPALDRGLDAIRRGLTVRPLPDEELSEVLVLLNDAAPDTEDYSHPLTSDALNAAAATVAVSDYLRDRDIDHLLEAAQLGLDTADFAWARTDGATPVEEGWAAEWRRQAEAIAVIQTVSDPGDLVAIVETLTGVPHA